MRLPVIQTCGECKHREEFVSELRREHSCSHGQRGDFVGSVHPDQPPPSWCPLRTGPDEAELDALRARVRELEAERDRIHKMFDDAGQGEHNVLALVDYYVHELEAERAELEALRAVADDARYAAKDLTEHVDDEDCAGPRGTGRQGACRECRVAEHITAALRRLDEVRRG